MPVSPTACRRPVRRRRRPSGCLYAESEDDAETSAMAELRREHRRLLANGWCTRPSTRLCFRVSQRPLGTPQWRSRQFPTDGHDDAPGRTAGLPGDGHNRAPGTATGPVLVQARGTTPLPAMASAKRTDWPSVRTTWAWCNSRSTRAEAMVLSINWSKPEGWMLVERARERFS